MCGPWKNVWRKFQLGEPLIHGKVTKKHKQFGKKEPETRQNKYHSRGETEGVNEAILD